MPYVHGKSLIKIAFADDCQLMHDFLVEHFNRFENCKVVIQAYNGRELLEKLRQKPNVSLVVLDNRMPEMDGVETASIIRKDFPELKILFSSYYENELACCRAIGVGADGLIGKSTSIADYKRAIFEVMKGGWFFPNGSGGNMHRKNGNGSALSIIKLSEEEIIFLKLSYTDKTYRAIAKEMKSNDRRVDYIREGLFQKFDVHSRVELALLAHEGGL